MSTGTARAVADVVDERARQLERWSPAHDDVHGLSHLIELAADRLGLTVWTEFDISGRLGADRPELIEAAALLVAAIELVDRQESSDG